MRLTLALACLFTALCDAQNWELGAAGGYGFYRDGTMFAPGGTAQAGIKDRFTYSLLLGEEPYEHIGGEFRFTYQDGDPFLSTDGQKINTEGHSYAFSYEVLLHLRPREARVRPYFTVGGGAKQYAVNGVAKGLGDIGFLNHTSECKPLLTAGAGVKYRVADHVVLRFDFIDYITGFPKQIIVPATGASPRGLFQQFTPMGGISFTF